MKHKIFGVLIILLFLAFSANAADFLDGRGEVGNTVKQLLGYSTNADVLPDSIVLKWVKIAAIDVNTDVLAIHMTDTIYTTAYTEAYAVDSMIAPLEVYCISKDSSYNMVRVRSSHSGSLYTSFKILKSSGNVWESHSPYYDWIDGRLVLYPVPVNTNDTIVVEGIRKIQNIETDTSFVSQLDLHYRPAVLYRACYLTARSQELGGAADWLILYDKAIASINNVMNNIIYTVEVNK